MSIDLGRRLIAAGLVSPEEVEAALFLSVAKGVPFPRVLLDRGAVSERNLEDELDRVGGLGLRQVAGAAELWARVPRAMCRRLAALPTRVDPATGTVDVAAADPLDPHVGSEFGFHLGLPIRVLRAPIAAVEEAIRRLELDETEVRTGGPALERARARRMTPPFPHGAPQSTIPPPVLDETPIPLVRKLASATDAPPGDDRGSAPPHRAGGTLVPPMGAPPLARLAVPAPRPVAAIPPSPYGSRETRLPEPAAEPDRKHTPRPGRQPPVVRTAAEPPAVSFPSTPPGGNGDRTTPPYGTPVYDPLAMGGAGTGYRIAPPVEDPYPLGLAPAEEEAPEAPPPSARSSAPPRKTTLPSAAWTATRAPSSPPQAGAAVDGPSPVAGPVGPRRPARPALGDVPYPAAIPQPAPTGNRRGLAPAPQPELAGPSLDDEDGDAIPLAILPKKARAPDGGPVLEALQRTMSRDEVIRVAMRGMRLVARRLAVFAVKRDGFYGWACNVEFGDAELLRDQKIPGGQPSVLATATATAIYLGPVPATPAHEGLLRVMERASSDVAAVAVRVGGRPALVLVCDDLDDTMIGTRFLIELGRAVGEALARLIVPR